MKKIIKTLLASAAAITMLANVASAEIVIDEARFGATLAQPEWIPGDNQEEDQWVVTGEVLFKPVNIDFLNLFTNATTRFEQALVNPRPHIGALINFDDDGTSSIYTGFTWHFPIGDILFAEATFGFGINDGETEKIFGSGRADLGSHVLFRESVGLGVNLTDTSTFSVHIAHQSHAGLAGDENHGLTNVGGRLGFKF